MRVSKRIVKQVGTYLRVNFDIISVETLKKGIEVEFEHGYIHPRTNITNDSILMTAKIALAHLDEYPDYYERLERMEIKAKHYWSSRRKPSIYL